jgi:lipoate-protein ligase B
MACDICGKRGVSLESLRDVYKTAEVQDVCSSCASEIDKAMGRVRSLHVPMILRFIENLRDFFRNPTL